MTITELVFLRYKINEKLTMSLVDGFKDLVQSFFGLSAIFINELAYTYIYIGFGFYILPSYVLNHLLGITFY